MAIPPASITPPTNSMPNATGFRHTAGSRDRLSCGGSPAEPGVPASAELASLPPTGASLVSASIGTAGLLEPDAAPASDGPCSRRVGDSRSWLSAMPVPPEPVTSSTGASIADASICCMGPADPEATLVSGLAGLPEGHGHQTIVTMTIPTPSPASSPMSRRRTTGGCDGRAGTARARSSRDTTGCFEANSRIHTASKAAFSRASLAMTERIALRS